jgi:Tfp pilus assembly protein PilF
MAAASREADPAAAGRRLGATYVLEGSVQRHGDSLRVTARLIETRRGSQLWAQQYDRDVAGIFLMQDEIATQVVSALELRVANVAPVVRGFQRAVNPQAYLAYLHGRALVGRFSVHEAEAAAEEFARAIALDPGFAAAYAAQYDARMQAAALRRQPQADARRRYGSLLERALELDPDSGAAWYARAMWSDADTAGLEAAFRRGVRLEPGNSRGLTAYSEFLDAQRRPAEAKAMLESALRADPLAARARFRLSQRNFEVVGSDVEKYTLSVLELDPSFYPALQRFAKYRWMQHADIAQAIAIVERAIAADPDNPWGAHTAAAFYLDVGDVAAARAVVRQSVTATASTRAMLAAYDGDWRKAGEAALDGGSEVFGVAERWCVVPALRDYALRGGDRARVIAQIASR